MDNLLSKLEGTEQGIGVQQRLTRPYQRALCMIEGFSDHTKENTHIGKSENEESIAPQREMEKEPL